MWWCCCTTEVEPIISTASTNALVTDWTDAPVPDRWGYWSVGGSGTAEIEPTMAQGGTVVGWRQDGLLQTSGFFRFQLNVAQGTTLNKAQIYLGVANPGTNNCNQYHDGPNSHGFFFFNCQYGATWRATVYAHDVDNSSTDYTTDAQFDGLTRTTASTDIQFSTGGSYFEHGDIQEGAKEVVIADVTDQTNEVLARGGWVSGNLIMYLFDENGSDHQTGALGTAYGTFLRINAIKGLDGTPDLRYRA